MTYCNEDFFPALDCQSSNSTIVYGGNRYTEFFQYPDSTSEDFNTCRAYSEDNPDYSDARGSDRMERLHTCFSACKGNTADPNIEEDTRPDCDGTNNGLLCVDPSSDCEDTYLLLEVESDSGFKFDLAYTLIAIPIANLLQYAYLLLIIFNSKSQVFNFNSLRQTSFKCMTQILIFIISACILLITAWQVTLVTLYGPSTVLWGSFLIAFCIDQVKSLIFLIAVYYMIIQRMCEWRSNEEEYINPEWLTYRKDTNLIRCNACCAKVLEARSYEVISISFLLLYAVFVLIVLSADDQINDDETLNLIDQAFLSVFLLEILCKFFVQWIPYFYDIFNTFDAIIVITSFVLFFVGLESRGLAVLRLLRLVRLVIVLRKVSASGKRKNKTSMTALEEGLGILRELRGVKKLSFRQKKDLKWIMNIIETNKLYDVTISQQTDKNTGQQAQDLEARKWINMATLSANDPLQWFDRDLDDYLYERQRDNVVGDEKEIYEEEIKSLVPLSEKVHYELERMFEDIGKWRFNAFRYAELAGSNLVSHFMIKLFQSYDITRKFEIPTMSLKAFTVAIYDGYSSNNPFHNATHAVDVAHKMNYFISTGNLMKYISDLDIMASLIACIIHDYQHPSVSNEFLIRRHHQKALRFNDISVLERHHLASAFAVLLDQNCDITINLTEDQYWVVRTSIIKMVLATDLKLQEQTLGAFKNSRGVQNFPNNDNEKQILMNLGVRIAAYGNPLQPQDLYFKWMSFMMEELYQQGDIEDHLGMKLTVPFLDRRACNPYEAQLAFIDVILEPMVSIWVEFVPEIREDVITYGLSENMRALKDRNLDVPEVFDKSGIDNDSDNSSKKNEPDILG